MILFCITASAIGILGTFFLVCFTIYVTLRGKGRFGNAWSTISLQTFSSQRLHHVYLWCFGYSFDICLVGLLVCYMLFVNRWYSRPTFHSVKLPGVALKYPYDRDWQVLSVYHFKYKLLYLNFMVALSYRKKMGITMI